MKLPRTHRFRVLTSSWGVAVDLTAHFVRAAGETSPAVIFADASIGKEFHMQADDGLQAFLRAFPGAVQLLAGSALLIDDITYALCDFQPEGVACAVAGWRCDEFELAPNPLTLKFNTLTRRSNLSTVTTG